MVLDGQLVIQLREFGSFGTIIRLFQTNNQTSRPSKTAADLFDNDPLLCEIVLEHWNVEEVITKHNKRMYTHQYHVQNGTNDELFQKFRSENQDVRIGFTSFKSIKPFYVRPCKSGDIANAEFM